MNADSGTAPAATAAPDLTTCDREPIRIPGAIQPHGILLVLSGPEFRISAVSANVTEHLAVEAASLLGRPLGEIIDPASLEAMRATVQRARGDAPSLVRLRFNHDPGAVWRGTVLTTADGVLVEAAVPRPDPVFEAADLFDRYDRATRRLRQAADAASVCQILAEEVRELTGFDRVMIYHFAPDWSGEVIAEAMSDRLPSYLGLHFPASDIPVQARELYSINVERLIPDINYVPVPLIRAEAEPVDLSMVSLRSVSPVHIEYLRNMGVRASMSVSIMRDNRLWGLAACHHSETLLVPPEIRQACVLLGQLVSWQLTVVEEEEELRLGSRVKAIETEMLQETTLGRDYRESLLRHGSDLLTLMSAGGLALSNGASLTTLGTTPQEPELRALIEWLVLRGPEVFETNNLQRVYPPAVDLPEAAGLMAVPLGGVPDNIMVWFRPEIMQTVTWGGNPEKPMVPDAETGRLSPRLSFDAWKETVRGCGLAWERHELAAAQSLRDMVADIILRRSMELEELNAQLIRSNEELEAFAYVASHDLKEPLRQIETFGTLLERVFNNRSPTGADPKRWFEGIQSSSRRLRVLIDDLAKYSRLGRHANPFVATDLNVVLEEVRADLGILIDMTGADISIDKLPTIMCDHTQMRQVMQNLIANALKYRHPDRAPAVKIAATVHPGRGGSEIARLPVLELSISDNGIGFEEQYRDRIFEPFQRLHSADEYEGSGIGLAICRKILDRHGGVISARSTVGVGSVFTIRVPMRPLPHVG